ncbi:MAG: hypothetical protein V4635_12740 [Bacteroidota bacterium]
MRTGIKITMVFVVVWISLLLLEDLYDFGLKQNQNIKMASVKNSPPCTDLLVHGPCEPLWMISPALLDQQTGISSYNLALSHSDFADNYLHLYYYLKYNKAPKYLLLYVTPESLDKHYNTFNSYRFAPYLSDTLVNKVVRENDPAYFKWTWIPFMKYAYYNNRFNFDVLQGYKHYFSGRKSAYYPDGFEPPTKRAWGNHTGEFAQLYKENTVFKPDSLREKYLHKTIRMAKEKKIRVFLYESPVLYEALAFQPNRDEMIDRIKKIAVEEQVPFIQFEKLAMAKEKRYFVSTLNFNMEGVILFNDTLGRFFNSVILGNEPLSPCAK